jgi:multidrug efflux pump subunit AcrB
MIAALLQRPVAVLLSSLLAILLGVVALFDLPVSLLPDIEAPQVTVQIHLEKSSAEVLENLAMAPLREALAHTGGLKYAESVVSEDQGFLTLGFEYGTDMDMACLELNERIDRVLGNLPREMPRPLLIRSNTSDIPILRLQVVPKEKGDIVRISALADQVIRRKLEQIPGVSMVDLNGLHTNVWLISPKREILYTLGISEDQIQETIRGLDQEFGTFSVKDGHYRYFVHLASTSSDIKDIGSIPVQVGPGAYMPLSRLADISGGERPSTGYHLYNGKQAVAIQIRKQAAARMDEVAPRIREVVGELQRAHPEASFELTRDQSLLLNAGIGNLYQVIAYGTLLSILILFLFIGNLSLGLVLGLTIPVSLLITFALFRCCGISLNIISLSGLALGVGMLIDHSIIVLDAISRKIKKGKALSLACSEGAEGVFVPVLGQTLTSVAVYAPLILLPGISGMLVFDQAVALSLSLGVSLLVAFILVPLLCRGVLGAGFSNTPKDTTCFKWLLGVYHLFISAVLARKGVFVVLAIVFVLSAAWAFRGIRVEGLPEMDQKDTLLGIDWREPISASENLRRFRALDTLITRYSAFREAEVGPVQFALTAQAQTSRQVQVYYTCSRSTDRRVLDAEVRSWIRQHYPRAGFRFEAGPNALNQVFSSQQPFFEVRLRALDAGSEGWSSDQVRSALRDFPLEEFRPGLGTETEAGISLHLDMERMALHRLSGAAVAGRIGILTGTGGILVSGFGTADAKLYLQPAEGGLPALMEEGILTPGGQVLPLSHFLRYSKREAPAHITADKSGRYFSLKYEGSDRNMGSAKEKILAWAQHHGLDAQFTGRYFESRENLFALGKIFLLTLVLLYFILALQFDHVLLPLAIMSALAFGISGALWLVYISGASLNIMAAIGLVVVLGIIIDDPILKVEVIRQLWADFRAKGYSEKLALEKAVESSGVICLKPMLMTTLTTCLALVPVFFTSGIGSELQRPLALVVIGGLTAGTFFTSWFIPLLFTAIVKK